MSILQTGFPISVITALKVAHEKKFYYGSHGLDRCFSYHTEAVVTKAKMRIATAARYLAWRLKQE